MYEPLLSLQEIHVYNLPVKQYVARNYTSLQSTKCFNVAPALWYHNYNSFVVNYQPNKLLWFSTGILKLGFCCLFFYMICNCFYIIIIIYALSCLVYRLCVRIVGQWIMWYASYMVLQCSDTQWQLWSGVIAAVAL